MTDVRALLRNEKAARRITHPLANYSATGVLTCRVCRLALKSEAFWDAHLHSKEHAQQSRLEQEGARLKDGATNSKKRKAGNEDRHERKKSRGALPDVVEEEVLPEAPDSVANGIPDHRPEAATNQDDIAETVSNAVSAAAAQPAGVIDEDEWAAFEREVATPPPEAAAAAPSKAAVRAGTVIEAAPISAAELAEQEKSAEDAQKGRREVEIEEEKEEATRQLEDEFEDMTELEQRVQRLKEKREALRLQREQQTAAEIQEAAKVLQNEDSQDESEDEEDEWDPWR